MSTQDYNLYDEFIQKTVSTRIKVCTRRSFKVYRKLKVVKMFERGNSVRSLSKKFGLTRSTIKGWVRNKQKLFATMQKYRKSYCISNRYCLKKF